MLQQMVRQVKGKRRLADADRPGKDQRMRQFSRAIGGSEHRGRLLMADQAQRLGRLRYTVQCVVLLGSDAFEDHAGAACRLRAGALASSAANTTAVMTSSTAAGGADASITMQ